MPDDVPFIGVCTPFVGGYYFGAMLSGIQQAADEAGVPLLVIQERLAALRAPFPGSQHVAGWIVLHPTERDATNLRALCAGTPVVIAPVPYASVACTQVQADNRGGMRAAVLHLIDHGHRRIAYVHHGNEPWSVDRFTGYGDALAERGIELDQALVFASEITTHGDGALEHVLRGRDAARRLIDAGMPCTALVSATDNCAIAAMEVIQAAGYRIPEDLALIGFDDIAEAQYTSPPLATMRTQFDRIGRAAAEQLLREIAAREAPRPTVVSVPASLLPRPSCGCQSLDAIRAEALAAGYDPARWQEQLVRQLLRIVRYPLPISPADTAAQIWPGAELLAAALAGVARGEPPPSAVDCAAVWAQAVAQTENIELLFAALVLIEDYAEQHLAGAQGADRQGLTGFLRRLRLELMRARLATEAEARHHLDRETRANHQVSIDLFSGTGEQAQLLGWLGHTSAEWACLGLWEGAGNDTLRVAGIYRRAAPGEAATEAKIAAAAFPWSDQLPEATMAGARPLVLSPISTAKKDWGMLAIYGWADQFSSAGAEALVSLANLLGASLDRHQALLELSEQQATLQASYERERVLAQTILDIGCPLIPILPGVLLVPLVGAIDSDRAQQILSTVLGGIESQRSHSVVIDLTGVPIVDTQVAGSLINTAQAATMLGARVMVVGIRPEIAQSIVSLGIDLRHMHVFGTLAGAISALQRRAHRG